MALYSETRLVYMFNWGTSSSQTSYPIDSKIGMEMFSYLLNSQNRDYKVPPPDPIKCYLKLITSRISGQGDRIGPVFLCVRVGL